MALRSRQRRYQKRSRTSARSSIGWLIALVAFLLLLILTATGQLHLANLLSSSPQSTIESTLVAAGYSSRMARFWVCVSAFETSDWASLVYEQSHNLWGMGVPDSRRTSTRNGILVTDEMIYSAYASDSKAAADIIYYLAYFHYPKDINSLTDLVALMKTNGYFEGDETNYIRGTAAKYDKLYGSNG